MKTLDEVIKTIDYCMFTSDCNPCSYKEVKDCTREKMKDALHYLQDYRMLVNDIAEKRQELEAEKARYQEAVRNCEEAENKYRQLAQNLGEVGNPALTWEQLKTMEGKPVWVEDGLENGEWYIIECFTNSDRFIAHDRYADDTVFKAIDMGNMWQAYRKERS